MILKSNIPDLIRKQGWSMREFYGRSLIAGVSQDTAKRAYRGGTNFSAGTLAVFTRVFDLTSIAEVVDVSLE